jgi:hypothetical protein
MWRPRSELANAGRNWRENRHCAPAALMKRSRQLGSPGLKALPQAKANPAKSSWLNPFHYHAWSSRKRRPRHMRSLQVSLERPLTCYAYVGGLKCRTNRTRALRRAFVVARTLCPKHALSAGERSNAGEGTGPECGQHCSARLCPRELSPRSDSLSSVPK